MQIQYQYKGKLFNDIRDITHNNNMKIDYETLLQEYLPYQIFVSGKTIWEGLTIQPSCKFRADVQHRSRVNGKELLQTAMDEYLKQYDFDKKDSAITVSGGLDSAIVALCMQPDICYSGYYDGDETCNERNAAYEVIERIPAATYTPYCLTEEDFITTLSQYIATIGTPIGGLGGVMEMAVLRKAKEAHNLKSVVFGNGGDEIFMGYYWNHFIMELADLGEQSLRYIRNFTPARQNMLQKIMPMAFDMALCRWDTAIAHHPRIFNISANDGLSVLEKILSININKTLPSLLHINNQICNAVGVKGHNPLANRYLINRAVSLCKNNGGPPKYYLRSLDMDIPDSIRDSTVKTGFKIPVEQWCNVNMMIKESCESFFRRKLPGITPYEYNNIDRKSWGVFMAELFIQSTER